jgi:hypothetical protein
MEETHPNPSVVLTCVSLQDDATVKCWGSNYDGNLGQGDTSDRGDNANGACLASSTTASTLSASRVLTLAPDLRVQRWGQASLRSTWGAGGRR